MSWVADQTKEAVELVRRYGRQHRRWLVYGLISTVAVVILRLALPWPFRWAIELVVGDAASGYTLVDDWGGRLTWILAAFGGMAVSLGFVELRQRVAMKQYAAATVHSLREDALRTLTMNAALLAEDGPDVISRVISDTARIKAELSGIMLHASQNGLLYLGITVVFLVISPKLGLAFLVGGVLTTLIGVIAKNKVTPVSLKQREKEGDYAAVVQTAVEQGYLDVDSALINDESERREVRATRLIALAAWAVHVALAVVIVSALWLAFIELEAGRLGAGELFLFMAYGLTIQRRMVQFGRQTARSGKMVANLSRLGELINLGSREDTDPPAELTVCLELSKIRLRPVQRSIRSRALKRISLEIHPGEKVAVVGRSGAGKSALLRVLAGHATAKGQILWDGHETNPRQLFEAAHIRFLPQVCVFRRQSLSDLLGISSQDEIDPGLEKALGLRRVIRKASRGLDTKFSSSMLTIREARGLMLYGILQDLSSSMWILDGVTEGLSRKRARRILSTIVDRAGARTVIVSLPYSIGLEQFDRVLALRKGRLKFDGTPANWRERVS